MRYLLDTHTFLWALTDAPQLSPSARRCYLDAENELVLSVVCVWEMAIKASLGKLTIEEDLAGFLRRELRAQGIGLQAIELEHVLAVRTLPLHHRDPFDRLLIAQALALGLPILGCDAAFDAYGVRRVW